MEGFLEAFIRAAVCRMYFGEVLCHRPEIVEHFDVDFYAWLLLIDHAD